MKIGILCGEIPPPNFIHQLIVEIANKNHEILVYGKEIKENIYHNKKMIILKPFYYKKKHLIKVIFLISKVLLSKKYSIFFILLQIFKNSTGFKGFIKRCFIVLPPFLDDLDIFHIQWAKSLVMYPEYINHLNCPVVVSLRGAHINYSPLIDKKLALLYTKFFPKVNGVHAVSKAILEESKKYINKFNKFKVIPPAVNRNLLYNKKNINVNINDEIINIFSIGRCHWKKGYTIALDAMRLLKDKGIRFHYTIIANGKDNQNINYQINDLNIKNNVTFINGLEYEELIRYLCNADLFLLSSVEEGIPNALLESMALGIPIVATDCGGVSEVINNEENGFLVPIRNHEKIVESIIKYISMNIEQRKIMIQNAQQKIKEKYLLDNQVNSMVNFYKSVKYEK